jgi:hypothetical protein
LNGLYFLGETGVTPKLGPSKLPGRYAAGFIYWGVENKSFFKENYAPGDLQVEAHIAAILTMLGSFRSMIAEAQNI